MKGQFGKVLERCMQKMCKYGVGKIGIVAKKYIIFYVITWQKNSNE
jgi:hypothetical protein